MRRYLELLRIQFKASLLLSLQYRLDFFVQIAMALFWSATALVPLWVLFSSRNGVAGWDKSEMLVVVGFFTALKGVLSGAIQPPLANVVEQIRKGTLDFLLLKPVDAQFMLSTSKLELTHVADVLAGAAIAAWALWHHGVLPSVGQCLLAALITLCAIAILYSILILVVSLAFHVVKVDNLSYLVTSTFEAARWPSSVFRGALAFIFTFVFPLAIMTTYPALALLGRLTVTQLVTALGVALSALLISRFTWKRALRAYTSAGG